MNIVSLLPSTTEICYALGLGPQLRGVTHECDFPPAALHLPHLTRNVLPPGEHSSAEIDRLISERILNGDSIYDLDVEHLARIEPDLILTQRLCEVCAVSYNDVIAAARSLPKSPVVASFEPHCVDEILWSIEEVARLAGVPGAGDLATQALRDRLASVTSIVADCPAVRVVCLEWLDPPMVGGHWVPEMVRLAGGDDVLGPERMPSVQVTWEQIVEADPHVIVLMPCGFDLDTTLARAEELRECADWPGLRAVQAGRVFAVDGSGYFNRPGPRIVAGIEILAHAFHPSRVAESGTTHAVTPITSS